MADIKEVNGVFGGLEIGNINDQETTTNYAGGVEGIGANNLQNVGTNLPAKQGFWSKFKAFWLQPVDWKKEIKVESKKTVTTGDNTNSIVPMALLGISLLGIYIIVMKKYVR